MKTYIKYFFLCAIILFGNSTFAQNLDSFSEEEIEENISIDEDDLLKELAQEEFVKNQKKAK